MKNPQLPPVFTLKVLNADRDPFDAATESARTGDGQAGDFFWSSGAERIELAIVLEPEAALADSLPVLLLAMVAFGDALGALAPPVVAVHFRWPDQVKVNGGFVGGFRAIAAEVESSVEVPEWLVIGFDIAVQMDPTDEAPGLSANVTTLYDEGCGEVTVEDLTESFARHFLAWMNRWQDEGFEPVRLAWLARRETADDDGGSQIDLDSFGGLLRRDVDLVPLAIVLGGPSWKSDVHDR